MYPCWCNPALEYDCCVWFLAPLCVWGAKGRCKKLGHTVLTLWPVVLLQVYPAVCCSYALFSFLGHPDMFYMCFLGCVLQPHSFSSLQRSDWVSHVSTQGVQKVQIQRSSTCYTELYKLRQSVHRLEQKLCRTQLIFPGLLFSCETTRRTRITLQMINIHYMLFFSQTQIK